MKVLHGNIVAHHYPRDQRPNDRVHRIARAMMRGDPAAISLAVIALARLVPPRALLVPIPGASGRAVSTLEFADQLAVASDARVLDVLEGTTAEGGHELPTGFPPLSDSSLRLRVNRRISLLRHRIFLVDNVIEGGTKLAAARRALGWKAPAIAWARSHEGEDVADRK
jgi:hypothetical protein